MNAHRRLSLATVPLLGLALLLIGANGVAEDSDASFSGSEALSDIDAFSGKDAAVASGPNSARRLRRARQLRRFIDHQVGGIQKLMVPDEAHLPQPRLPDGTLTADPRFRTTEAKRYLGKLLFFDPVRTARILPEYGGVLSTRQTGSCGSCHLGEAASRSNTIINLNVGGEGRGFTDASGKFIARRRLQPGLVDTVPTLTEVCTRSASINCAFPSNGLIPATDIDQLVHSGRADAVDSVPRNTPNLIGFAFNNRTLQGGLAGDPAPFPIGVNPDGLPAGENVTQATSTVHRMFQFQSAELQQVPSFAKLFTEAFPEEDAAASAQNDPNLLISDETVQRAMATFLRTVVTRNTAFDRFLAGDDAALTRKQQRGARLFFTEARPEENVSNRGERGAGCFTCHNGPVLNKQRGDEIANVLVEENFFNIGLHDHELQDLNRTVLNDPGFRDRGRQDVNSDPNSAFKFRVPTLRQLRDSNLFTHNGLFTTVKDVVNYFNAGVPQDAEAAAAGTLAPRFTNPRGPGSPPGLGLKEGDVEAITDFLENSLYDPAFVKFHPNSTTRTFQPDRQELTYSIYRPDLAALGTIDGLMPSGRNVSVNDALSRRDAGLEFLDVTNQLTAELTDSSGGRREVNDYEIRNTSSSIVDTHLLVIARGLSQGIRLKNASGTTSSGDPYLRVFLPDGVLLPGESISVRLVFKRRRNVPQASYTLTFLSGQGKP